VPFLPPVLVAATIALARGGQTDCSARPPDLALPSYRFAVVDAGHNPVDGLVARAGVVMFQETFIWRNFDYGWVDKPRVVDVPIIGAGAPGRFATRGVPALRPHFILEFPTFKRCWERFGSFFVAFGRERPPNGSWSPSSRPADVAVYQVSLGSSPASALPPPTTIIEVLYPLR
jgi:hypothetical protein